MSYARDCIARIAGYVPGEQPQGKPLVKLNTNENPYPPSPKVFEAASRLDIARLRLYPEPSSRIIREAASRAFGVPADSILCGNGSDDLLTIALRTFVGEGDALAFSEPSYSLYPVLADLQGARKNPVRLTESFDFPDDAAQQAGDAKLFLLACPNAPTGNLFDKGKIRALCQDFRGVVWIDEAYADFAERNCLDLIQEFPNVIVSRTLSKSFSLAGLRLGIAFASEPLVFEMNKVRDSYNVDMITQHLAAAALDDIEYMRDNAAKICATRDWLSKELAARGAKVLPSSANFIFVEPKHPAQEIFSELRTRGFLVRYFNLPRISQFIRITIGRPDEMQAFLKAFEEADC